MQRDLLHARVDTDHALSSSIEVACARTMRNVIFVAAVGLESVHVESLHAV
jgi:hypothetical protein